MGKEPQGHDAEHGLLTHITIQDLCGFFHDECLEGPEKNENLPQRGIPASGLGLSPLTQSNQLRVTFFLT